VPRTTPYTATGLMNHCDVITPIFLCTNKTG